MYGSQHIKRTVPVEPSSLCADLGNCNVTVHGVGPITGEMRQLRYNIIREQ